MRYLSHRHRVLGPIGVAAALCALGVACGGETGEKKPPQAAASAEPAVAPGQDEAEKDEPIAQPAEGEPPAPPADDAEQEEAKSEDPIPASVSESARLEFAEALRLMADDPKAARAKLEAAVSGHPEFYVAQYNLGVLHDRAGELDDAEAAYKAALEAKPGYPAAVVGLSRHQVRNGDLAGAERILNGVATQNPEAWAVRAARAKLWAIEGKGEEARAEAVAVLKGDERNAEAMLALGMVFRRQKKYELATLAVNQALGIDPNLGAAYNELGQVLLATDKKAQAVQAFERAARASPEVASIHNNLGALRNEVGAFKAAIVDLETATRLDPNVAAYYLNLGNALRGDQRYEDAEKAYKKALETRGGTPDALFNLGVLYLDNELPGKEIVPRFEQCIQYLQSYTSKVSVDEAAKKEIDEYISTAQKAIESEHKKTERAQRRAEREKAAAQKAAEEKELAQRKELEEKAAKPDAAEAGDAAASGDAAPAAKAPPAEQPSKVGKKGQKKKKKKTKKKKGKKGE